MTWLAIIYSWRDPARNFDGGFDGRFLATRAAAFGAAIDAADTGGGPENYIELLCLSEVREFLGGPAPREVVERDAPEVPGAFPGIFAVDPDGELIGTVAVDRRDLERPGKVGVASPLEISYAFLPQHWGRGLATEAVARVLVWLDEVAPMEPVVLCTQVANEASLGVARKLGFIEVDRFVEFGAEQWFGVRESSNQGN